MNLYKNKINLTKRVKIMDWGMDGSFMSRPKQGWLHAGQQLLPDAGVRYIVKVGMVHGREGVWVFSFFVWFFLILW